MKNTSLIQLIIASVLTLAGIGLLYLGALIAPEGEIHETILIAFGEVATFAGSILGIDYHYKTKYKKDDGNNPTNPETDPQSPITNNQSSRLRDAHPPLRKQTADL